MKEASASQKTIFRLVDGLKRQLRRTIRRQRITLAGFTKMGGALLRTTRRHGSFTNDPLLAAIPLRCTTLASSLEKASAHRKTSLRRAHGMRGRLKVATLGRWTTWEFTTRTG